MQAEEMWRNFLAASGLQEVPYTAWAFGASPDQLADLVLRGEKTATSSAYELYGLTGEPLPQAGEYSVILDGSGQAVCVTETLEVFTLPFCDVPASHAFQEGEGDKSLDYWREVHTAFFRACLEKAGLSFSETTPVLCETFRVVYPLPNP